MANDCTRKLAIMFTDLVGYSRMMGEDEQQAIAQLETYRGILGPIIEAHHGSVIEFAGDSIFARFNTATEAVDAGMEIQRALRQYNVTCRGFPLHTRIGIHYGEVQDRNGHPFGDDVNIAARLEPLCDIDGICVSKAVRDELNTARLKHCIAFGKPMLKNISGRFPIYHLFPEPISMGKRLRLGSRRVRRYFSDRPFVSYSLALGLLATLVFTLAPAFLTPRAEPHYVQLGEIRNLNPDEMPAYYTIGISDEIKTHLKEIPNLYVTKPDDGSSPEIQLTGSVQQMGDKVRLAYRMIRSRDGMEISGASFSGSLDEMLDLQAKLAENVVADISHELHVEPVHKPKPEHEIDPEAYQYYLQARDYASRPDDERSLDTMIHLYKRAIRIDPNFAAAHAGLCQAYWSKYELSRKGQDVELAEQACHKARQIDPNSAEVHVALGEIMSGRGLWDQAIEEFNEAIRLDPRNLEAYIKLADVYNDKNDHRLADQTYRRAIRMHPGQWEAWSFYGRYQFNQGDYKGAIRSFEKVVDLTPDNSMGYANLGGTYLYAGQFKKAAEAFRKQAGLRPNSQAILNAGTMYYYDGNYSKAAEMYRKAIEMDPEICGYWSNLSDALVLIDGKADEARAAAKRDLVLCDKELKINPVDYDVLINKASALSHLGRNEEANETMVKALAIAPNNPQIWLFNAILSLRRGDMEKVKSSLARAVKGGYPRTLISAEPAFDPVRRQIWFKALLKHQLDNKK